MKISPVARSMILVVAPMNTPIDSTAPRSTITPSTTSERAPMKQSSSMITGSACSGSSTPPMPTPPERWQLRADLRAASHRGPGVHHGAAADMGADIDEAGHQHHAGRDVGAAAHHRARHGAEAGLPGSGRRPSRRTSSAPCPTPARRRRPASARESLQPERQQHRLLQPLVDPPARLGRLGHPRLAARRAAPARARRPRAARPRWRGSSSSRRSHSASMVACSGRDRASGAAPSARADHAQRAGRVNRARPARRIVALDNPAFTRRRRRLRVGGVGADRPAGAGAPSAERGPPRRTGGA